MILVLGPSGAGKSTILSHLRRRCDKSGATAIDQTNQIEIINHALPTVGCDLVSVAVNSSRNVVCREVGGCLFPLWNSYLSSNLFALIFVVDASDLSQVAFVGSWLNSALYDTRLQRRPVLIVFNKHSLCSEENVHLWLQALRFNDLKLTCFAQLSYMVCDAVSGHNIERIQRWMEDFS